MKNILLSALTKFQKKRHPLCPTGKEERHFYANSFVQHSLLGHWHKFLWSRAIVVELNVRLGSYEQLILKDAIVAVKNVVISRLKAGAAVLPSHQRGDRLQLLNTGVPNQTYPIDERDKSRTFSR
ncbi:hypothetical protein T08_15941 [Trichinella sp. T8]|nr:hypothetical protein T08_15941 [Trichinella sp. T8]